MTREDAIKILKDIQRKDLEEVDFLGKCAIDMAIEALKNIQVLDKIPNNYLYDTETEHCLVYRHKYTGKEIHILKPTDLFVLERPHGEWVSKPKRVQVDETDEERIFETKLEWFCSSCDKSFGCRKPDDAFCKYCGSDNRKRGEAE